MSLAQLVAPVASVLSQRCAACSEPGPALCRTCRFALATSSVVRALGGVDAAMRFEGVGRSAILGLKYGNRRPVAAHLARLLVRRLRLDAPGERFDVVTWAPTSAARQRERGFDQAELLAREVGRVLGVPCRRLLQRAHGAPQTGRARAERVGGGRPSFRARPARRGLRVLLVDDVVTTGSTLAQAERALRDAGVQHVRCAAVAATPTHAPVLHLADRRAASRRPTDAGEHPGAGGSGPRLAGGAPVGSIPA